MYMSVLSFLVLVDMTTPLVTGTSGNCKCNLVLHVPEFCGAGNNP